MLNLDEGYDSHLPNVQNKNVVVVSVIGTFLPFDLIYTVRTISAKIQLIKECNKGLLDNAYLCTCRPKNTRQHSKNLIFLSSLDMIR